MKTLINYILSFLVLGQLVCSCAKPNYVAPNDDSIIKDFYATLEGKGRERLFESTISNDTIYVNIDYYYPIDSDNEVDLSKILLKASVPVDAKIEPSLEGFTDLNNPLHITVTAGDGTQSKYVVVANKKGNTDVFAATLYYEDVLGATQEVSAIILGTNINFSLVPGTVLNNPRVIYTINRHASASIPNGGAVNLDNDVPFVVTSAGNARKTYTMKVVEAKKLAKGIRPGSARVMFAKKLKDDLGLPDNHLTTGLAVSGKYLVINTRNRNSIYLNGVTGQKEGEVDMTGFIGSLRNFYATSDNAGNILVCNLTTNDGNTFMIYKVTSVNATPQPFISWNTGGRGFGRKFSVVGDINQNAIITAPLVGNATQNSFARWQVSNGQLVSQTPDIIDINGYAWNWNNADVKYMTPSLSSDYYVVGYNPSTNNLGKVSGQNHSVTSANTTLNTNFIVNSVDYIEFNNGKYVAYNHVNGFNWGSADQVFLLDAEMPLVGDPSSATAPTNLIWAAPKGAYGPNAASAATNTNGAGDVVMAVSENGYFLYLYFMFTNGYVVGVQFDCIDI